MRKEMEDEVRKRAAAEVQKAVAEQAGKAYPASDRVRSRHRTGDKDGGRR